MFHLPKTEAEAAVFLQHKGVLPYRVNCEVGHEMRLNLACKRLRFRCGVCEQEASLRSGTWLENTKLPLTTLVRFIYGWSKELTSVTWCAEELGMSAPAVVAWNHALREVCFNAVVKRDVGRIGGPGQIVEIDESMFTKRKNHVGRVLPQQWVFGGLCRATKQCFATTVPDRSAPTLFRAILKFIEPGSVIYSDSWKGYRTADLIRAGFDHQTVNHTYNFVNPTTQVHTQSIERLWGSMKWRNKKHRGTRLTYLNSYLIEFMWRQHLAGQDPFESILQAISVSVPGPPHRGKKGDSRRKKVKIDLGYGVMRDRN